LIKMKDKEIIFQFNNELGYATLLIAKHKNSTLEHSVNNFNNEFSLRFKEYLVNFDGLIDISKFFDTKFLINKCFNLYTNKKSRE
jgi:hypothetical protein